MVGREERHGGRTLVKRLREIALYALREIGGVLIGVSSVTSIRLSRHSGWMRWLIFFLVDLTVLSRFLKSRGLHLMGEAFWCHN